MAASRILKYIVVLPSTESTERKFYVDTCLADRVCWIATWLLIGCCLLGIWLLPFVN